MKRFAFYLSVSLLTHLIGFTAVWLANFLPTVIALPQNVLEVTEELEVTTFVDLDAIKSETLKPLSKFMPTGRGCGNGYAQGYSTYNGQWLGEGVQVFGSSREARRELTKWIAKASRIVERVPNYKNRFGDLGERIVILNPPTQTDQETISIFWYGGDNAVSWIDAPTLELALEFERTNAYAY